MCRRHTGRGSHTHHISSQTQEEQAVVAGLPSAAPLTGGLKDPLSLPLRRNSGLGRGRQVAKVEPSFGKPGGGEVGPWVSHRFWGARPGRAGLAADGQGSPLGRLFLGRRDEEPSRLEPDWEPRRERSAPSPPPPGARPAPFSRAGRAETPGKGVPSVAAASGGFCPAASSRRRGEGRAGAGGGGGATYLAATGRSGGRASRAGFRP